MAPGFTFAHLPGGMFDARGYDPTPSFTVPPKDDYIVGAIAVEPKENNNKTGGHLEYTLEIQQSKSGSTQYAKITVPYRLHIFHNDGQVMNVAYKQLSAMAHVIGRLQLQKPEDLLCNPQTGQGYFIATIGPQKDNENYPNVFGVKDLQGNVPGKSNTSAVASTPAPLNVRVPVAPPAAAAAPPWQQPVVTQPSNPGWMPPQPSFQQPAPAQPQTAAPWQQPSNAAPPAAAAPPWQQNNNAPAQPAAAPAQPAAAPAPAAPPWAR